ncbi:methyltransferase domain-containing protein [Candidatus Dependentiae bacterium]|nr:methyltransferase domain-containing protein [Candidatus Dependentiae bacterium]
MKNLIFDKFPASELDAWFSLQLSWTHELREYICRKVKIRRFKTILELGSGTGRLLEYFYLKCSDAEIYGTELSQNLFEESISKFPEFNIIHKDSLSFLKETNKKFDIIYCHFYLLWERDRVELMKEVKRHLEPNGFFIIFSEPDYGGVLESPEPLRAEPDIKSIQVNAGDPYVGRKLLPDIRKCEFKVVESGLISKIKSNLIPEKENFYNEFKFYKNFWSEIMTTEEIDKIRDKILVFIEKREYFYFLPIMYFILRP